MPSLRAKNLYVCERVGLESVLFIVLNFLLAWVLWQQNASQRNQNVEAGCGSQCETKSLIWSSARLSYRVLVTWISFGEKKFGCESVLDWSINFPWFDEDNISHRAFYSLVRVLVVRPRNKMNVATSVCVIMLYWNWGWLVKSDGLSL